MVDKINLVGPMMGEERTRVFLGRYRQCTHVSRYGVVVDLMPLVQNQGAGVGHDREVNR